MSGWDREGAEASARAMAEIRAQEKRENPIRSYAQLIAEQQAMPPPWVDVITIHYTEDDLWQVAFMADADSGRSCRADGFGTTRTSAWSRAMEFAWEIERKL